MLAAGECPKELTDTKPKVYIATFLVTYGKKEMGQAISDSIAEKFSADGRFVLVPRADVHEEMKAVLSKKNMKVEDYLRIATEQAAEHKADCLIFGKISKKGEQISFLVRMADVASGENRIKKDDEVERSEAGAYFENLGDGLVKYFVTVPQIVAAPPAAPEPRKQQHQFTATAWGGYNFIKVDSTTQSVFDILDSVSGSTSKLGGVGGGADAWMRLSEIFEVGGGLAFLPLYQYKYDQTVGTITTNYNFDVRYLPIMAQARFISSAGFYIGAGVGFYLGISSVSVTQRDSTTGLSVSGTASGAGSAVGANLMLGWQIALGEQLAIDIGVKGWFMTASGSGVSATPYAGISLRF